MDNNDSKQENLLRVKIKSIKILSTNRDKINEIKHVIKNNAHHEIIVEMMDNMHDLELIEIQGEEEEIILAKCKISAERIYTAIEGDNNFAILVEDTSFGVDCMNGLPGPYIRDFFLKLGNRKLYKMFMSFKPEDNSQIIATETCYIGLAIKNSSDLIFKGEVKGRIVQPDNDPIDEFNWNFFFKPEGSNKTYGYMTVEEKSNISARNNALLKLCDYLNNY